MTSSTWESESDAPRTAVTLLTSWMEGADTETSILSVRRAFGIQNLPQPLAHYLTRLHGDMPERTGLLIRSCVKSALLSRLDGGIRCYGACRQLVSYCQWVL